VKHLARKKIVLVIVEGASDETALGVALSKIYDNALVHIHIMHGDITTRTGINSENIIAKLGKDITSYAKSQHYTAQNFKQIIHIVDTDATYIPDEQIIEDYSCKEVLYEDDGIHTRDVPRIIARNSQKRENILRLRSCNKIWNIPYRVYYMSCNFDHVLHDKRNSTDEEKEQDSYAFARNYKNNINDFIRFLCDSDFSVNKDFKDSWEHIEKGMNSIRRYTNFSICIQEDIGQPIP